LTKESNFCIVPHQYRVLQKLVDTDENGEVTDTEINSAIAVLEKAKRAKQLQTPKSNTDSKKSNKNN
jgi:uncharacterized protein YuzE